MGGIKNVKKSWSKVAVECREKDSVIKNFKDVK